MCDDAGKHIGETTLISLTKNLVYKNIEAQMWKKVRTIIRTSPALKIVNI